MGVMTIRELNANVSKAISRVEAGETIEITKNGRKVVEIRPTVIAPVRDEKWHAARARMDALMAKPFGKFSGKVTHDDKYGDAPL